jgi:anti-sigma-K factor RskA
LAQQVQRLKDSEPDTISLSFKPGPDPDGKTVSGTLVWSAHAQKGYLRFRGLPKNDPSKGQYQLWIFDSKQDERYPIDGGIFDIDTATGEAIVAIDARLKVVEPKLFAVTIEKPGGVVVSSRDRIVALAQM